MGSFLGTGETGRQSFDDIQPGHDLWKHRFDVNARTPDLVFQGGDYIAGDIGNSYLTRSTDGGETWTPTWSAPINGVDAAWRVKE